MKIQVIIQVGVNIFKKITMANHSTISRDNPILAEEVLKTLQEINKELFDGVLPIDSDLTDEEGENWICVALIGYKGVNMWVDDGKIDIRHNHNMRVYWWLDHLICCELSNRLGGNYSDDGAGDMSRDNGIYTYRNFKETLKSRMLMPKNKIMKLAFSLIQKQYVKSEIKETEKILPKPLFDKIIEIPGNTFK